MDIKGTTTFGRAVRLAAGAAALALTVSACSSSGSSKGSSGGSGGGGNPAAAAGATAGGTKAATGGGGATVVVRHGSKGTFLTDSAGLALYVFAADSKGKSNCSGACTTYWPPLTTTGTPHASGGAKAADLGTIKRADGSSQVTYAGHPLYRFEGDRAPGDTTGQGLSDFGGKWWLLGASGAEITGSGGAAMSSSAAGGGGYGGY